MADLFAYPFHLNPDGTVAKLPDGENYYAHELANLIQTSPGERPLVPDYGVEDPVFSELNTVELLGKIEMFGPPVVIPEGGVVTEWPRDGVMSLDVDYAPAASDDESEFAFEDDDDDEYYDDDAADDQIDYFGFNAATDY